MANSVEVSSTGQVVVTEVAEQVIEVVSPTAPLTVEVQTAGPQGPPVSEVLTLADLVDVDVTGKVASSVLYYDTTSGKWLGNDINTVVTLTDGGNF